MTPCRAAAAAVWMAAAGVWFCAAGCSGFTEAAGDAGLADTAPSDGPAAEAGRDGVDGPPLSPDHAASDVEVQPGKPCRVMPPKCLASSPANIIDVPGEADASTAFTSAKAGDTIQINGKKLGAGWRVPPYVTLRGCNGAEIVGWVGFEGSAGTVEGFTVPGSVLADKTGVFVIRHNRFVDSGAASSTAAVTALSTTAYVAAAVTVTVESNWFEKRKSGIEARTKYDIAQHSVDITIHNNVFAGVDAPITLSEGGATGKITARTRHNTFHGFKKAISMFDVGQKTTCSGDLFVSGELAIYGSATYDLAYCFVWKVTNKHTVPPLSGAFATGDPAFKDSQNGDFSLTATSAVIDAIPASVSSPTEDYLGCPRPMDVLGKGARSDVGAIEAQP